MNDPRRWLDDPDALSPEELRVLEAGLEAAVPKGAKAAVKSALLAQLPAPTPQPSPEPVAAPDAAGVAPGASTVATATAGAFLKSTGIGFALGVAATVSWVSVQGDEAGDREDVRTVSPSPSLPKPDLTRSVGASSVPAPGPSIETRSTLRGRDVVLVPQPEVNAGQADIGSEAPPAQAPSVSTFPEAFSVPESGSSESTRLAQARARLRNNDPNAAFAALESLRRDHPRGLLVQERELLSIEALHAMGNEPAASARARDFLARYPKSPHTATVRRVLERRRPGTSP